MIYDMVASGKRLKELRKQAGKTQEQVAEAVGLEPGTISRIERGAKGMSIDSLLMFSEIYGVSTDYNLKLDKLSLIAKFFGISVSDFIEDDETCKKESS